MDQCWADERYLQNIQGGWWVEDVNDNIILQVELNMEDIKQRTDSKGRIMKSDFIEYSIEAKLLDLTDCSRGKGKDLEEKIKVTYSS